jgi:hypothetical protein
MFSSFLDLFRSRPTQTEREIIHQIILLKSASDSLSRAMCKATVSINTKGILMNPILQSLADQVTATVGVMSSATTLITGFSAAALANGATAAQLAPITDEVAALKTSADALAAAVAAMP